MPIISCSACGNNISSYSDYCPHCNQKPVQTDVAKSTSNIVLNQNQISQTTSSMNTEEINLHGLDSYYQTEFTKIIESGEGYKGKWNWYAFLFGWIWCFTKGAWIYALIILVPLFFIYPSVFATLYGLAWCILLGMRGTWLYYNIKIKNKQPQSLF